MTTSDTPETDQQATSAQAENAPDEAEKALTPATSIDPKLLEVLVCPQTRGALRYDRNAQELVSERAGLAYPIRDGVPIMLPSEARALDA